MPHFSMALICFAGRRTGVGKCSLRLSCPECTILEFGTYRALHRYHSFRVFILHFLGNSVYTGSLVHRSTSVKTTKKSLPSGMKKMQTQNDPRVTAGLPEASTSKATRKPYTPFPPSSEGLLFLSLSGRSATRIRRVIPQTSQKVRHSHDFFTILNLTMPSCNSKLTQQKSVASNVQRHLLLLQSPRNLGNGNGRQCQDSIDDSGNTSTSMKKKK